MNRQKLKYFFSFYLKAPIEIRAALWFLVCSLLQSGISVLMTPVFTRLLSTSDFGQYSVYQSWSGIITIFVSLRLSSGVYMQGLVKFDDESERYSSSMQGLTLTLCILWIIVYSICPRFWNAITKLTNIQTFAMLASIWSSSVFGFWAVEQRVNYRYRSLVIVTLVVAVLSPVASIVLVLNMDDKVTARIMGMVLVNFICGLFLFVDQMKRGRVFFYKKFWRYALLFNIPLIPHYISQNILNGADRIMIRDITGASYAGIYSIAYSIAMLMMLFNSAIIQTIDPWMYRKIREKKVSEIKNVAYPALIFIAAVNIILIAFAPEVIKIFAPPAYYDAVWLIPPIAMSAVFIFSYDLFVKFEFYYEKPKFIMATSVAVAATNILLNYIFIRMYGYMAAAYTTLFCYVMYAFGHFWAMKIICNKYLDAESPYSSKILMFFYSAFLCFGFLFLIIYRCIILRYLLIMTGLIILIIYRNYVKRVIKMFLAIRKEKG